jgi:ABC-type phosphate/phosphonate transport system substrate-binding protein
MIANARMYSVSREVDEHWRALLSAIIATAGAPMELIEHAAPEPIENLWRRTDMGAVFMCGLPFSRAEPQPVLVAAPVPAPDEYGGEARYWSELVVRADSDFQSVADTFGSRIAFTVPESQSGYAAALTYLAGLETTGPATGPLFSEIVAPTITPLGALSAVIQGNAEVAPVDSYAFALLRRYRPDLTSQVRSVAQTRPTPIPALVASGQPAPELQAAFLEAHQNDAIKPLMDALSLQRFVRPDAASYAVLRQRYEAATRHWRSRPLARITHPAFAL